jgi:hypothetical protein
VSDLRARIAAALESADRIGYGTRPYTDLADAVIAELADELAGFRPATGTVNLDALRAREPRRLWDVFADADNGVDPSEPI